LEDEEKKYLIQIMPPADIMPEIVRFIVLYQSITNAGILFDDSVGKTAIYVECAIIT
jgi:ionotropic glutamate receptor